MNTQKRASFIAGLVILSLIFTQSIFARSQAEYTTYLPLVVRSSFVPSVGVPDFDFGDNGLVTTSLTAENGFGRAVAMQTDGKLVVAGSIEAAVDAYIFLLARFNTDGSLDTAFGDAGWVRSDLPSDSEQINDLALQEDGKLVVAGSAEDAGESSFAVARYNPDGSLDTSFDGDGWLLTDFGAGDDYASSIALQPDGKILSAGTAVEADFPNFDDFALARYNADGSLDTGFGEDGMVQINNGYYESGNAVALQADGKIVVAGTGMFPGIGYSFSYFVLARYNADGSLDAGFAEDGWLTTDFSDSGGPESCEDVLMQPDGKIVAAGWANNNSTGFKAFALARYNADGSLDASFDGDGMVITIISDDNYFGEALALQANGKLVVAGYVELTDGTFALADLAVARYNPDGSLDVSFSQDGWLITDFSDYDLRSHDLLLQADGDIVLAGEADGEFALARYDTVGSLDNTFDLDGVKTFDMVEDSEGGRAVALQADGKIVVGGFGWNEVTDDDFLVARYNPDGSLDSAFGAGGWVTTTLSAYSDQINELVIQADGKILVVGNSYTDTYGLSDFALARYNPDGSLDSSFDGDGWLTTDFAGEDDQAYSVALQPDGKIVVAGQTHVNLYEYHVALARYNPDGSLDSSFDEDGLQDVSFNGCSDGAGGIVVQPDGKIVIAGWVSVTSTFPNLDYSIALMRFNPDGSLDNSFDTDGIVNTDIISGASSEAAKDLVLQPDGKIVAAGYIRNDTGDYLWALLRYTADGALDASFDGNGWVLTSLLTDQNFAQAVQLQPDGKILVAGYVDISGFPDNESVFALARFNSDGSLDTDFSEDGWLTSDFQTFEDECYDMALQPDGKIVLAGEAGGDFVVARYK